jgi:hypothetical protein
MTPGIVPQLATSLALPGAPSAPDCSTWDFFFNSAAWKACQAAKERAQIQQVAANAAYYYGPNSPQARAAAQAAADQAAQAAADQENVGDYYGAGSLIAQTPNPDNAASMPTWVMAALIVGTLMLLRK